MITSFIVSDNSTEMLTASKSCPFPEAAAHNCAHNFRQSRSPRSGPQGNTRCSTWSFRSCPLSGDSSSGPPISADPAPPFPRQGRCGRKGRQSGSFFGSFASVIVFPAVSLYHSFCSRAISASPRSVTMSFSFSLFRRTRLGGSALYAFYRSCILYFTVEFRLQPDSFCRYMCPFYRSFAHDFCQGSGARDRQHTTILPNNNLVFGRMQFQNDAAISGRTWPRCVD